MQIDITGHQMEITEALRSYIEKDLAHLEQHVRADIQKAHVVLDVNKHRHHCDIHLTISGGVFNAKSDAEDMYIAINQTVKKIQRQLNTAAGRQNQ